MTDDELAAIGAVLALTAAVTWALLWLFVFLDLPEN
jgi:hypothetical protein